MYIWHTKAPTPNLLPKFVFSLKSRHIIPCSPKEKKSIPQKHTFYLQRLTECDLERNVLYFDKIDEISNNEFEIFGKMFEFLSKMLKILFKVFKNWCENSIIRRKNTEIYPKKLLKMLLLSTIKFKKGADSKALFECNDI